MQQNVKSAHLALSARTTVLQLCRASVTVDTSALSEQVKPILQWTRATKTMVPAPISFTAMPQVAPELVEVPSVILEPTRTPKEQQSSLTVHQLLEANILTLLT